LYLSESWQNYSFLNELNRKSLVFSSALIWALLFHSYAPAVQPLCDRLEFFEESLPGSFPALTGTCSFFFFSFPGGVFSPTPACYPYSVSRDLTVRFGKDNAPFRGFTLRQVPTGSTPNTSSLLSRTTREVCVLFGDRLGLFEFIPSPDGTPTPLLFFLYL